MNFKSIFFAGLSIAAVGLTLPAHAQINDTATTVDSKQEAVITGNGNYTRQNNKTEARNSQSGRRTYGNTGTAVSNDQFVDVQGNFNDTKQNNTTKVENSRRRSR